MKNLINYYYGLIINKFRKIDDKYIFIINDHQYLFEPLNSNIEEILKIYYILKASNRYCHEIIMNNQNSVMTFYQNKAYILIKINYLSESKIDITDILYYDVQVYEKNIKLNWKNLWQDKIDYYEYQINQFGFKYKLLRDSFSYYLGLCETAISILNYVNENNIKFNICHRRINYNDTLNEFLNPLNIIIDNKSRDVGAYIKTNFINEKLCFDDATNIIDKANLNYDEALLFLSRLLYPSYYFDTYDDIVQEKISEDKILFYIKKNISYEIFLKKIYKYLKFKYNIIEIEWLEV